MHILICINVPGMLCTVQHKWVQCIVAKDTPGGRIHTQGWDMVPVPHRIHSRRSFAEFLATMVV